MKKFLISILLISFSMNLLADNIKKESQKIEKKQVMTDEEFLKKFMELEEREKKAIAKTEALEKLNKTADELLKTISANK